MDKIYEDVINYFKEICKIPHGSKNEQAISNWIVELAKNDNLQVRQDEMFNVVVYKEPALGLENKERIILQAHLDMVCEKVTESNHDFLKDEIIMLKYIEDGREFIKADGTTLGGDDGIGVAILLAFMLNNNIKMPGCYFIFTTQEEIGMYGAKALDFPDIDAKYLINLDSEEEDTATVGCAGGVNTVFTKKEELSPSANQLFEIIITGLKGGHSGVDINKGRINANCLMAMILDRINDIQISSWFGGTKDNVICNNTKVVFSSDMIKEEIEDVIKTVINNMTFVDDDKEIKVSLKEIETTSNVYSTVVSKDIIKLILNLKQNVIDMSTKIEGLVETSGNIGIVLVDDNEIKVNESIRSSVDSQKKYYADYNCKVAKSYGFECEEEGEYPGWDVRINSKLQGLYSQCYMKTHKGELPKILSIHAGLECGLFFQKNSSIDMISIGPNLYDVHTPNERLDVESVEKLLNTLIEMINNI